jgi:hypothetical protein
MRIALALFLVAVVWHAAAAKDMKGPRIPEVDQMGTSGKLRGMSVSVTNAYCWRDWMPIVQRPGPDGGSPLYVVGRLKIDNSDGKSAVVKWESYLLDVKARKLHAIRLSDKRNKPAWNGRVPESKVIEIDLTTGNGPYLPVGTQVILVFRLQIPGGETLWLKSKQVAIGRTE